MELACGHKLKFDQKPEVYLCLPAEQDNESLERVIWCISGCPDARRCSKKSWKKHAPWSFISHQKRISMSYNNINNTNSRNNNTNSCSNNNTYIDLC